MTNPSQSFAAATTQTATTQTATTQTAITQTASVLTPPPQSSLPQSSPPRSILPVVVGLIALGFDGAAGPASAEPAARIAESDLNIVIVLADDCTRDDLGCYGGQAATPRLDALMTRGMTFSQCYQAAPMCSPTRHCLYTGLYPVKSGAYPNHTFVKPGVGSIAVDLRGHGYRVALSGKRHINPVEAFPFEYSAWENNPDMTAIGKLLADCDVHNTPFLLVACSNEPHAPYTRGDQSAYDAATLTLPPTWIDTPTTRDQYAKYLAEITYFDSQVGEILDLLKTHHHTDDTLVIVLSEQGSGFPFAKWSCYRAGVQSGLIASWPGHITAGSRTAAMVEYVDVVPTVLAAAGLAVDRELDGRSFLPVLRGETDTHKQTVFSLQTTRGIHFGADHYGIRSAQTGSVRLIHNLSPDESFACWIDQSNYFNEWLDAAETSPAAAAIVDRYRNRPEFELYDIRTDPHEQTNRINEPAYAERAAALKAELREWMRSQGDEGTATEMRALERMKRAKKNPNNTRKKAA